MSEPTAPPTKPCSENDSALQQDKPLRTWRPMILWSAGIVLALGLAWFIGTMAVQVCQALRMERVLAGADYCSRCEAYHDPKPLIAELGGPERAAAKLRLCFRSPVTGKEAKQQALALLGSCGQPGMGPLTEALRTADPALRMAAFRYFNDVNPELARESVPALEALLKHSDESVRTAAANALKRIRGEDANEATR